MLGAGIPGAVWEGTVGTHEEHHLDQRERGLGLDTHAGPNDGHLPGVLSQMSVEMMLRGAERDEQFVIGTASDEVLILTIRIHFGLQVGEFF